MTDQPQDFCPAVFLFDLNAPATPVDYSILVHLQGARHHLRSQIGCHVHVLIKSENSETKVFILAVMFRRNGDDVHIPSVSFFSPRKT